MTAARSQRVRNTQSLWWRWLRFAARHQVRRRFDLFLALAFIPFLFWVLAQDIPEPPLMW